MGSSAGGFFPDSDITKKIQKSESETSHQCYKSEVCKLITSLLANYNNRDVEVIKKHLETIRNALNSQIESTIDILYGGSVAKHTYIDGISDVDALVLIDNSELRDKSPAEVQDYFQKRLEDRLPNTEIQKGNLAVTIKFKDSEIQILPAIKCESGFKISDSTGKKWSAIQPRKFQKLLTEVNQRNDKKVIPVIKLAKSIISKFPESQRLSGYHTEAMAVEIFQKYQGSIKSKDMLEHFFKQASEAVLRPMQDKTGQSIHVDDYLCESNSRARRDISNSLNQINEKMERANILNSIEEWEKILGV